MLNISVELFLYFTWSRRDPSLSLRWVIQLSTLLRGKVTDRGLWNPNSSSESELAGDHTRGGASGLTMVSMISRVRSPPPTTSLPGPERTSVSLKTVGIWAANPRCWRHLGTNHLKPDGHGVPVSQFVWDGLNWCSCQQDGQYHPLLLPGTGCGWEITQEDLALLPLQNLAAHFVYCTILKLWLRNRVKAQEIVPPACVWGPTCCPSVVFFFF